MVAENDVGSAKNKIYLDINNIPVFVKGLSNQEVEIQENLKLELLCTYKSKPKADVSWFFGDRLLKDGDDDSHYSIFEETGNEGNEIQITQLKILNAGLSDSGSYKCKLKNSAGEVNSNGTLAILKPPKIVEGLPEQLELIEKKEIKLVCKLMESVPKSTISWHKDGVALNNPKKYIIGKPAADEATGSFVYTLVIPESAQNDAGVYSIKSANKVSTVESKCTVFILSAPKITKDLKPNLECTENDKVHIEVTAVGRPLPEFKWYWFNIETNSEEQVATPIDGFINTNQNDNIYSIDFINIKQTMKGKYTLKLSNKAGSVETSCNIVVNGKNFKFEILFFEHFLTTFFKLSSTDNFK